MSSKAVTVFPFTIILSSLALPINLVQGSGFRNFGFSPASFYHLHLWLWIYMGNDSVNQWGCSCTSSLKQGQHCQQTLSTLVVINISFDISLLLLGMYSTRLGVGSLWLGLPPPSRLWRKAPTSRSSSPTIIIKWSPPSPLIPKERVSLPKGGCGLGSMRL